MFFFVFYAGGSGPLRGYHRPRDQNARPWNGCAMSTVSHVKNWGSSLHSCKRQWCLQNDRMTTCIANYPVNLALCNTTASRRGARPGGNAASKGRAMLSVTPSDVPDGAVVESVDPLSAHIPLTRHLRPLSRASSTPRAHLGARCPCVLIAVPSHRRVQELRPRGSAQDSPSCRPASGGPGSCRAECSRTTAVTLGSATPCCRRWSVSIGT